MKVLDFKPRLFSTLKNYSKETFMSDLMAGIIVGIVALPLAIAFGIASGVSPEKGIITAIIAGFIISLLGGSKVQIGGPTRSIHRHHLWHHPAIWRSGINRSYTDGRHTPDPIRSI